MHGVKQQIKKAMCVKLFDDVLGTLPVCLITKYCSSCKLTYYPGYAENYEAKQLMYEKIGEHMEFSSPITNLVSP